MLQIEGRVQSQLPGYKGGKVGNLAYYFMYSSLYCSVLAGLASSVGIFGRVRKVSGGGGGGGRGGGGGSGGGKILER